MAIMFLLPGRDRTKSKARGLTIAIMVATIWAFIVATYWIMQPTEGRSTWCIRR